MHKQPWPYLSPPYLYPYDKKEKQPLRGGSWDHIFFRGFQGGNKYYFYVPFKNPSLVQKNGGTERE